MQKQHALKTARERQQNSLTDNLKYGETNRSVDGFKQASLHDNLHQSAGEYDQSKVLSPKGDHLQREDKKKQKINQLMLENKRLRISNKQLKKQLQIFQKRLDETLKKRVVSEKKPRVNRQIVENMQLKNAYKQCDIYKRQISNLKKKQALFNQQKVTQLNNVIGQMQVQRQRLLQQIKGLKRISKMQQKSLVEMTDPNFTKIIKQYSQLKQQNKKLSERISKQDRQAAYSRMSMNNQKRKNKQAQVKATQTKKKQQQKQTSQLQLLKSKTDKDSKKIVHLTSQVNRLNAYCDQLKQKLEQRDKQITTLKLRLGALRKQVKHKRLQTEPSGQNSASRTIKRTGSKQHMRLKSQAREFNHTEMSNHDQQNTKKPFGKYPKLVQAGTKNQNSHKWNHHQYSSKIKQLQISQHQNGHISALNLRYEKGEPSAPTDQKFPIRFVCEQNTGQYVKKVKGGFKDGLLMYLTVETSKGRVQGLGLVEKEYLCGNFVFGGEEGEYPGAFFGEGSVEGINRIGCLIQCLK